jgi:eukaryotic-like serine/threonine-protein kinase
MTPDAGWWPRLEAVFHVAVDLPPDERLAFLDHACGTDAELRGEIEALLAADAPDRALRIERLVCDDSPAGPDPFFGMRLGAWRVVDLIGRGGMGSVYRAERADGQYEQQVALKVVPSMAAVGQGSTRFHAERHILARVTHPNIARLLDAGLTPEGSAYLVMEYVDGSPITTYCDDQRLTIVDRLRLFRAVSNATQHAHQSLVVHSDLKPANIFVSQTGEVKLLDFGIAKLLEPERAGFETTARELRALTPAYAAPEQLLGDPVTTATDVYVLGVVLYELLTGERPAEVDPVAPSQAIRRRAEATEDAARMGLARVCAARRTTPAKLARRLSGDIDRVIMKALRIEPDRRYFSAGQLTEEIERLLDGRPVTAQPDTLMYRTRRFVGRHRVGVGTLAAVVVLSTAFAVVAWLQARAVASERDRARIEARRAERVSLLVADLFKLAEPAAGRGETITARELLEQASDGIGSELQGDAATQAALFNVLGRVYGNLGLHDRAIDVLARALALQRGAGGGGTAEEAETLHRLGVEFVTRGDYVPAEQRLTEALAHRRRLAAPARDVAATLEALGRTLSLTGRMDGARTYLEEAVALRRGQHDVPSTESMSGLYELGSLLHQAGELKRADNLFREAVDVGRSIAEPSLAKVTALMHLARFVHEFERDPGRAEPLYREALEIARTLYAGDHAEVANCLGELARDLRDLKRLPEAEAAARESSEMYRRLYGDRHDDTLIRRRILAGVLRDERKLPEAERILRDALTHSRSLFGDGNPTALANARELAGVLEDQGRYAEALEVRLAELASAIKEFGEAHVYVAISLAGLGRHSLAANQVDEAYRYFTRALQVRQRIHPANHWRIDEARGMVGNALLRAGRFADAEAELLAAYDGLLALFGAESAEIVTARQRLVELYEGWHRPEQAARFRTPKN